MNPLAALVAEPTDLKSADYTDYADFFFGIITSSVIHATRRIAHVASFLFRS